jgi:type II secretory pathway pseudopilin PulG
MRAGWTMIELIIILIIIGILAAIALSKLAATRDDAKLSADVSNMNICLRDIGSHYTATMIMDINTTSCNKVYCYTIDVNGSIINVDINSSAVTAFTFCEDIESVGGHLIKSYQFSGQSIKR